MSYTKKSLMEWIIATRPWSFPASTVPVLAMGAYMFYQSHVGGTPMDWLSVVLALPMMVLLQASGNLIGDYYDYKKGVDLPGSLNGVNHIHSGRWQPREVLSYGYVLLLVAALFGLCILLRVGMPGLWLGIAAILLVVCYPWLKAHALGDLDIALGYGLLPSLGMSLAASGTFHCETLVLCLPFTLLTIAILHTNNTRDIRNDRRAGILTFAQLIGGRASIHLYVAELAVPYLLVVIFAILGLAPWLTLLTWATLPIAMKNIRQMLAIQPEDEQPIATLDKQTAQLQLMFGLLYTIGFAVSVLIVG